MGQGHPAPCFFVSACEASADMHGARVIEAVAARLPGATFIGVGGDACAACGMRLVAHARTLGFMGFTDVLGAIPRILGIMRRAERAAQREGVRAALLIDAPDFNLRLARRLARRGIPVVYFISPKLWATRAGRAALVRRYVDRMLVIFPFEVEFYRERGVTAEYVGNPVVEQMADRYDRSSARAVLGLRPEERVVAMLPGSRRGEVTRLGPDLGAAAELLRADEPDLRILVPCAPTVDRDQLAGAIGRGRVEIIDGKAREVLAAADAAVVAAGTATLEAAMVDVPTLMIYRVSWLSWLIYRFILRIRHISLINIIARAEIVTELLQHAVRPAAIARELKRLLSGDARHKMRDAYARIREQLGRRDTAARVAAVLIEEADNAP